MDTLPLPPRPDLFQYKKRAKELVAIARSADPAALHVWTEEWLRILAGLLEVQVTPFVQHSFDRAVLEIEKRIRAKVAAQQDSGTPFTLADAQFLIARAHGFETWRAFVNHLAPAPERDAASRTFERAADAVITGDLASLQSLLGADPGLVRARSPRVHRATLLHYIAANGVEDFRQKTPPNAVAITRVLLESGAEVDAVADTYGGGSVQTTMNLLVSSTHPADAGLQPALVETLLDFGAAIDGVENDASPLLTALAFGYCDAVDALARRGARIDNVVTAAAAGREDLVRELVVDRNTLRHGVRLPAPEWFHWPATSKEHIELALVLACKFGRSGTVRVLLELGVDPAARDNDRMTALHWAAADRNLELVKDLLVRGAPLEAENVWGGTVLDSTVYFAFNQPQTSSMTPNDYLPVIGALLAAGANAMAVTPFPTGHAALDDLLSTRR